MTVEDRRREWADREFISCVQGMSALNRISAAIARETFEKRPSTIVIDYAKDAAAVTYYIEQIATSLLALERIFANTALMLKHHEIGVLLEEATAERVAHLAWLKNHDSAADAATYNSGQRDSAHA
jgi:hypothetical protein